MTPILAYPMRMANLEERIAQWEQMAHQAPDDMAFLSLGSAYQEAGRLRDADGALERAIELNPGMSRAYQIRGQVLIDLGDKDQAAAVLSEGYKVAAARGDVMPQKAIGSLLAQLGESLPEAQEAPTDRPQVDVQGETIIDRRTGESQPRLPDPPMRGPTGKFIYDHFGAITWAQWIGQGTKVINELRLDFSNEQNQETYDQYMYEWLQFTAEEVEAHANKNQSR